MGSHAGRPESRVPQLKDLLSICRALNGTGARYVVVGGFAVILHGYARGTMDVDLLIDPSPANVRKVKAALAALPDSAAAEVEDDDVERYTVVRVADEIVVDLMAKAAGVSFEEVFQGASTRVIEGVSIPSTQARSRLESSPSPGQFSDVRGACPDVFSSKSDAGNAPRGAASPSRGPRKSRARSGTGTGR